MHKLYMIKIKILKTSITADITLFGFILLIPFDFSILKRLINILPLIIKNKVASILPRV